MSSMKRLSRLHGEPRIAGLDTEAISSILSGMQWKTAIPIENSPSQTSTAGFFYFKLTLEPGLM